MAKTTYTRICIFCKNQFISFDKFKKFCNLSCSTLNKNKLEREKKLENYLKNPSRCHHCDTVIEYQKQNRIRFCSQSCGALYSNQRKDWTKIKTGPKSGFKNPRPPKTRIKQCVICGKYHPGSRKTCSNICFSKLLSTNARGRLGGNTDPNIQYYDSLGNHCYLDSFWELIIANSLDKNKIRWSRPNKFQLSDGRTYSPDFYLIDYDVYVDPKAMRPNYYRKSKIKVQQFEAEHKSKCLIITQAKNLAWFHIQTMLLLNTSWS